MITHGPEKLEGARVLDEAPGALGLLLWQLLRDATLWAATPSDARGLLFHPGAITHLRMLLRAADPPPALSRALQRLVKLPEGAAAISGDAVAGACTGVARWAEGTSRPAVALDFSQAAALARPEDASAALAVARLAARRGEHARAETWLRRAVTVGRRSADWASYAAALLELGRLYLERENQRAARRFFLRAMRAASRRGDAVTRLAAIRHLQSISRAERQASRPAP